MLKAIGEDAEGDWDGTAAVEGFGVSPEKKEIAACWKKKDGSEHLPPWE